MRHQRVVKKFGRSTAHRAMLMKSLVTNLILAESIKTTLPKAKQARKNQSKIETKEMKFRPKIDVGDYNTKKKHVLRFLDAGNKVKITIMFRGREMSHPDQGLSILEKLADDLKDVAVIESAPKMEGRNMHMLIAPLPASAKKKNKAESKDDEGKDE